MTLQLAVNDLNNYMVCCAKDFFEIVGKNMTVRTRTEYINAHSCQSSYTKYEGKRRQEQPRFGPYSLSVGCWSTVALRHYLLSPSPPSHPTRGEQRREERDTTGT